MLLFAMVIHSDNLYLALPGRYASTLFVDPSRNVIFTVDLCSVLSLCVVLYSGMGFLRYTLKT